MSPDDADLRRLSRLMSECLGRIDEQVTRLDAEAEVDGDVLEAATHDLLELVDSVVASCASSPADLDRAVEHAVERLLQRQERPLVVRTRLAGDLAPAACGAAELGLIVERALSLCARHAGGGGGEILVATAATTTGVRLAVTCPGSDPDLAAHAQTLESFVAEQSGRCSVTRDAGTATLAIEFAAQLADR